MRNKDRETAAIIAADFIKEIHPGLKYRKADIGIILGTGWGDALKIKNSNIIPFSDIPGFSNLEKIEGHKRELIIGFIGQKIIVALNGRIHLNEAPYNPEIAKMVRLQTEMLCQLGINNLIITSAVGSLKGALNVGEIAVINGFVTLYAPDMPLWAGEFCSPEDTISSRLTQIALAKQGQLTAKEVGHVMLRGPFFEGRKYDKNLLAKSGAGVIGMSALPEACIAALYGVETLTLGFVTNDDVAAHSHEENLKKSQEASKLLGSFLHRIIEKI
ncbi:MAG: hypothetical protein PHG95_01075 [Patescibacteria group bacterium]|nr:hypothetical protein [Patescibacteria group bacterium]